MIGRLLVVALGWRRIVADPDLTKNPPPPQGEEKTDRLDSTGLDLDELEPGYFTTKDDIVTRPVTGLEAKPYNSEETRENTRGDLARGLLWLLTLVVGGVLVFIGLGRLEGTVLTQSIFPSLVALAGTALGFYFGSQTAKASDASTGTSTNGNGAGTGSAASGNSRNTGQQKTGG